MRAAFVLCLLSVFVGPNDQHARAQSNEPQQQDILQPVWFALEPAWFTFDLQLPQLDTLHAAKTFETYIQNPINQVGGLPLLSSGAQLNGELACSSSDAASPTAPQPTTSLAAETALPQDAPPTPPPPEPKVTKPELEIYGHAMLDMGYDAGQIDPNWFDVERHTKLPAFYNEFDQNGNLFAGVRQTRFGVKSLVLTKLGELKTVFEFELFGVVVDAGQTTFRLRQAYGNSVNSWLAKRGAPTWTRMFFPTPSNIGDRTAWFSFATSSSVGSR